MELEKPPILSKTHLSLPETQKIAELLKENATQARIALTLERSGATVGSAIKRGGGRSNFDPLKAAQYPPNQGSAASRITEEFLAEVKEGISLGTKPTTLAIKLGWSPTTFKRHVMPCIKGTMTPEDYSTRRNRIDDLERKVKVLEMHVEILTEELQKLYARKN